MYICALLFGNFLEQDYVGFGDWIVANQGYRDGYNFVIPKQSGPQWLCEMTAMATTTSCHETINSRMNVRGQMTPKWYLKVPGHRGHIKGSL
jgi:hypothetical protein